MERIGLLAGTFNPPTTAHEMLGVTAYKELGLSRLFMAPNKRSPHKPDIGPGYEARKKMCQVICQKHDNWKVLTWPHTGSSYTVDALKQLQEIYPDSELWFICGGDSMKILDKWERINELLKIAQVAFYPRGKEKIVIPDLPGLRYQELEIKERSFLSSTLVRELIIKGKDTTDYLEDDVAALITSHGWYQ